MPEIRLVVLQGHRELVSFGMNPVLKGEVLGHGIESGSRDRRYQRLAGQVKPLLIANSLAHREADGREGAHQKAPQSDFKQGVSL